MKKILDINKKTANLLVCLMFFGCIAARFLVADFPKYLFVYPDEANFVMIAQSLATGKGLSVYNGVTIYQKIIYSLCIAPAFLFEDPKVISRAILLINSLIMSLGVFPTYYLANRVVKKPVLSFFMSMFYLMSADLTYTMTFMSEVLFLPMATTTLCLYYDCVLNIDPKRPMKKHVLMSVISGVMVGLCYYIKEQAVVFLAGFFAYMVLVNFYCFVIKKSETDMDFQKSVLMRQIIGFLVQGITFLILRTFMQQVVFEGIHGSYQLYGLEIFQDMTYVTYFVYALVYYLLNVLMAFAIISVLFPVLKFDRLEKPVQRLLLFLVLIVLGMTLIVGFMISLREDYPDVMPRAHVRYLGFLYVPFLMTFTHLMEQKEEPPTKARTILDVGVLAGVTVLFALLYTGARDISSVDDNLLNFVDINNLTEEPIPYLWVYVLLVAGIGYALYRYNKKWLMGGFFALIIGLSVYNNYLSTMEYRRYGLHEDVYEAVVMLDEFESEHPTDRFLILNGEQEMFVRGRDTYDRSPNNFVLAAGYVYIDQHDGHPVDLTDVDSYAHLLYPAVPYGYYYIGPVDYIVVSNDFFVKGVEETEECAALNDAQNEFTIYDVGECTILPEVGITALEGAE